jgi:hypothetical protein
MASHTTPIPNTSQTVLDFHLSVFKGCAIIATFGASITFQVIIQQLPNEHSINQDGDHPFTYNQAQAFLAIAWLLFIVSLGLASFSLGILAINRDSFQEKVRNGGKNRIELICMIASFALQSLMLAAFFYSSLAISAYSRNPGITAAILVGIMWILALILWIVQLRSVTSMYY